MEFKIYGGNEGAKIRIENERERDGVVLFDLCVELEKEEIPKEISVVFAIPDIDIYSVWSPSVRFDRYKGTDWKNRTSTSRLASWMPLHALVSAEGKNRMTVAFSDAKTPTSISTGVVEADATILWDLKFFTIPVAPLKSYKATVRIDARDLPYYDAIYSAVEWWENDCGYKPAYVPDETKLPFNSLWYSYHQYLDVEDILRECALSKKLGMDTVIVDDGWQTDDVSGGYKFCGDWQVAPSKIPDMKEFVDRIHETGMKVMLWFSVPYIGIKAKNYSRFKDMILDGTGKNGTYFSLDPRYKEVREYLLGMYKRAVGEWGFDGLKLDFIDAFVLQGKSLEPDPRRDYVSLEDAVDVLMVEVTDTLREINPEVFIEFRQTYVGPAIRKYGNMLRVTDCPNDPLRNRQDVVNLRLTSGKTAVHSDMLMWNYDDTVEAAARQLTSILYSVPQISVKIARLNDEHKKMLSFYLNFWRDNRETLMDGKIIATNPETAYSTVTAEKDGKAIITTYNEGVIDCKGYDSAIVVNSTFHKSLIIKGAVGKSYKVLNCKGELVSEGGVKDALCELAIPLCGMVELW